MAVRNKQVYYGEYLQLDKLLDAQQLESELVGSPAHDEMLFIITHQAYELWFKQILHELYSIIDVFDDPIVEDRKMGQVIHRLARIKSIQRLLVQQVEVIESMTPMDFLDFRDLLVPASGFQSIQFKKIEILMGIKRENRYPADQEFFLSRLNDKDRSILLELEQKPSLLDLTDRWLSRMPFLNYGEFEFWNAYSQAVDKMLTSDRKIIESNPALGEREKAFQLKSVQATHERFHSLLDESKYDELRASGEFRFSRQAFLSALFVHLYRDWPTLYTPFRYLTLLLDIDELFTNWRQRHVIMVQRMLGTKIGTGGSSGSEYLSQTTRCNRVFVDLSNLSTYLLPRGDLPVLPQELQRALGFFFSGKQR